MGVRSSVTPAPLIGVRKRFWCVLHVVAYCQAMATSGIVMKHVRGRAPWMSVRMDTTQSRNDIARAKRG